MTDTLQEIAQAYTELQDLRKQVARAERDYANLYNENHQNKKENTELREKLRVSALPSPLNEDDERLLFGAGVTFQFVRRFAGGKKVVVRVNNRTLCTITQDDEKGALLPRALREIRKELGQ